MASALAFSLLMGVLYILTTYLDNRDRAKSGYNENPQDDVVTDDEYDEVEESITSSAASDIQLANLNNAKVKTEVEVKTLQ